MRKIILAAFMAVMMMLVPITSFAQTTKINKIENITIEEEELPTFYITESQNQTLNNFIENNFEGQEKIEAKNILNEIIKEDLEVNVSELANKLSLYIYEPIPQNEINAVQTKEGLNDLLEQYWGVTDGGFIENLFSQLLIKIIEMIKDRLGWIYTFFDEATTIFYDGINLFVNVIQEKILIIGLLFVTIVNNILAAPQTFIAAIQELFQLRPDNFVDVISQFIDNFNSDIYNFISQLKALATNQQIINYIDDVESFIIWIDNDPWEDTIQITGKVTSFLGVAKPNLIITCKGDSSKTDINGEFSLSVDPNPDSESIPAYEYYGMHNCIITVSNNNGEIKSSIKVLSYCFSGGKLNWNFLVNTPKLKNMGETPIITKILENLFLQIKSFFPKLSDIIDEKLIIPILS